MNKMLTILTEESIPSFTNLKWNYHFYFQAFDQKTFLTKYLPFLLKSQIQFYTNFQTGIEIIDHISRPILLL